MAEGIVAKWNKVSQELDIPYDAFRHSNVDQINIEINNKIIYKDDPLDRWQTPKETLSLGTGDCEDYAILKYAILHKMGFKDLQIVIGKLPRNGNQYHAWIEIKLKNDWILLDNRNNITPKVEDVKEFFTPIFTLSIENGVMIGTIKLSHPS